MAVQVGDLAPGFTEEESSLHLPLLASNLYDNNVVLYFYPKDDTPGCTKEAESFRDMSARFGAIGTKIIGVSKDGVVSHENFKKKYNLNFDLISDSDAKLAEAYGVWVEKSMFNKRYMGIERSTFLIDKQGIIRRIWRNVKVHDHVEEVLEAASSMKE